VSSAIGGMTERDTYGGSFVVERWEDGRVDVWISDADGTESKSVWLDEAARRRVAAFLMEGLT
jgi:hypothetical protein